MAAIVGRCDRTAATRGPIRRAGSPRGPPSLPPRSWRRGRGRPPANAARTSASRSTKIPEARSLPPGRSSSCSAGASGTRIPAIRLASTTSISRVRARQAPSANAKAPGDSVATRIGEGGLDRDRIGVDAQGRRRAELQRRDRQDAGAAADVEDAPTRDQAAVREAFQRGQAETRRRVQPGPEGHAGIESQHDVVGLAPMASPGGPDHEPAADPQDGEVGLPRLGPVSLVDEPGPQLADRAEPERPEVSERFRHAGGGSLRGRPVAGRAGRPAPSPAGSGPRARRGPRRRARRRAPRTFRPGPHDPGSR